MPNLAQARRPALKFDAYIIGNTKFIATYIVEIILTAIVIYVYRNHISNVSSLFLGAFYALEVLFLAYTVVTINRDITFLTVLTSHCHEVLAMANDFNDMDETTITVASSVINANRLIAYAKKYRLNLFNFFTSTSNALMQSFSSGIELNIERFNEDTDVYIPLFFSKDDASGKKLQYHAVRYLLLIPETNIEILNKYAHKHSILVKKIAPQAMQKFIVDKYDVYDPYRTILTEALVNIDFFFTSTMIEAFTKGDSSTLNIYEKFFIEPSSSVAIIEKLTYTYMTSRNYTRDFDDALRQFVKQYYPRSFGITTKKFIQMYYVYLVHVNAYKRLSQPMTLGTQVR